MTIPPENYLRRFGGGRSSCFHGSMNNGSRRLQFWVAKRDSGQRQAVAIKYDLRPDWYGLSEKTNHSSIRLSGVAVKNGVRCFYLRTTHGVVMEVVEDVEAIEICAGSAITIGSLVAIPTGVTVSE